MVRQLADGRTLDTLAQEGRLTRGLRSILTHHLLFAFNRLGIPAQHQHLIARSAAQVALHSHDLPDAPNVCERRQPGPATVSAMTADTMDTNPEYLRESLVAHIDRLGTLRTPQVRDAFRAVPRHLFLPGVDLATAYAPRPVVTRRAPDGTALSSASSPNIVARMLEQLDVRPGHRVLEIGAATGINAALLSELVGPTGAVVTMELDSDLAAGARANLTRAGYPQVTVVCGDGALGHPDLAPYDRIIVTAGAWDIVAGWWRQLAVGGRLVVPLRLHGGGLTRSIALDLDQPDRMVSASAAVCGFVPMRGAAEHAERHVRLSDDVVLRLDAADLPEEPALADALTHPAREHWAGVNVGHDEPAEHLDLWLATTSALRFAQLSAGSAARAINLVNPAVRWSGAALYDGGTLAYLATRPTGEATDEVGVIAHGPDSAKLAAQVGDLLAHWNERRPTQPVITAYPAATASVPPEAKAKAHILRPDTHLTIAW